MAIRLTSCVTTNSGEVFERAAKRKGESQVRTENQPLWAVGMRGFPGGVGVGRFHDGEFSQPRIPIQLYIQPTP